MLPVVTLHFLHITIVPYDLARLLAEIAGVITVLVLNQRQGISIRLTLLMAVIGVPTGMWGARLLDMAEYRGDYTSLGAAFSRNGSSIYGALFATFIVVGIAAWLLRVSFLPVLDAAAPALALGELISRIGCFCAGCCYGVPWNGPWAVSFPIGSFAFYDLRQRGILLDATAARTPPLHPVQLYAAALMTVVTVALLWRFPRRMHDGEVFALFLIAYGAQRLVLAPFRMEVLASVAVFSVLFIATGLSGLAVARRATRVGSHLRALQTRGR